jgi:hypothetical protein
MNENGVTRRYFFYGSLLAGAVPAAGFGSQPSLKALGYKSVNEKLNIAQIGAGGRGREIVRGVAATENIVALCDVNDELAAPAYAAFPKAARYKDFRKMLEAEKSNIDAVMIATPDHTHTPAALLCMQYGKHVYCEKPLTRTPWEARLLRDAAAKYKVATQMGNQGYSHEATRVCAEILWSGEIGDVREVHSFTGRIYGGGVSYNDAPPPQPVPSSLDWDLWLSSAAERPYNADMVSQWRSFIDFSSGGSLGDWIVHCLGPAHLALQLHLAHPTSVERVAVDQPFRHTWPIGAHLRFEFPARGNMPPVTIHVWQNMKGDWPTPPGMAEGERLLPPMNNLAERGRPAPPEEFLRRGVPQRAPITGAPRAGAPGALPPGGMPGGMPPGAPGAGAGQARGPMAGGPPRGFAAPVVPGNGTLFVGDKGFMATTSRGEGVWLLPASRWKEYELPPQMLPRSVNHQMDWVRACKGGVPACSEFNVAVPYIEWLCLGAIALRVPGKLLWDGPRMRFTNNEEANKLLRPYIRKGWEMKL